MEHSGSWVACSGIRAVEQAERRICGDRLVGSVAEAEGLALAGHSAATQFDADPHGGRAAVGWVHHRLGGADLHGVQPVLELTASDAQQAVDHCLVAHYVAARAGGPVVCRLDPSIAHELHLVSLPTEPALDPAALAAGRAAPAEVSRIAEQAFTRVSRAIGRPVRSVAKPPAGPHRRVVLGASPGGPAAEAFLLDVVAALGGRVGLHVCRSVRSPSVAALVLSTHAPDRSDPPVDVLLALDARAVDAALLETMADGGKLLLHWVGASRSQDAAVLQALERRRLTLEPVRPPDGDRIAPEAEDPARARLAGALLAAGVATALGVEGDLLEPSTQSRDAAWQEPLRDFHLTGRGAYSAAAPAPALPLRVPALDDWVPRDPEDRHYPFVPSGGEAIGLSECTPLELYASALRVEREPLREALRDELRTLSQRLAEKVGGEGRTSAVSLAVALGETGARMFDPDRLSRSLAAKRDAPEPQSRRRLERALTAMRHYLAEPEPSAWLVHAGVLDPAEVRMPGARVVEHDQPVPAALGLFRGLVERHVELFRALRVARLELAGAYRPERHDAALERFGWESFTPHELSLIPAVGVLETAPRIRAGGSNAVSTLVRSGLPVHLLVRQSADEFTEDPGAARVALALREAFVLQSTLADPAHLSDGLRRMAAVSRPGLAVIVVPDGNGAAGRWPRLLAAHAGRSAPCLRYDPDLGPTWAECLDLAGNPEPDAPWPRAETRDRDASGLERSVTEPLTPVQAAALDPSQRMQFRVVPVEGWSGEQLDLEAYLSADAKTRGRRIPFIRVLAADGSPARAVFTREMAFVCLARADGWRALQELASVRQPRGRPAVAPAAAVADPALELEHVRTAAVAAAMQRLVRSLTGTQTTPAPVTAAPQVATVEAPPEPAGIVEPGIDSALCTTCQDCIDLNPKMFRYNENKQAYLADVGAGTFKQLVLAAEKCPARCIHPGAPRHGDRTATGDMVARAERFNRI